MSDAHPIRADGTCCEDFTRAEQIINDILNMKSSTLEYFAATAELARCVLACPRRLRNPWYQDVNALLAMRGHLHVSKAA